MFKRSKRKKRYISLQEAAWFYGCTQKHMNLMARQSKLKAIKIGRNWFTTYKWLDEYIKITEKRKEDKSFILSFKNSFIIFIIFLFVIISVFIFFKSKNQELNIVDEFFYYTNKKIASVSGFVNDVFSSRKEFFIQFSKDIKNFLIIEELIPYFPEPEMSGQSYTLIKNIHRRLNNIETMIEEGKLKIEEEKLIP